MNELIKQRFHYDEGRRIVQQRVCSDCWGRLEYAPVKGEPQNIDVYCTTEGCQFRGTISIHTRDKRILENDEQAMDFRNGTRRYAPEIYDKLFPAGAEWHKLIDGLTPQQAIEKITSDIYGG